MQADAFDLVQRKAGLGSGAGQFEYRQIAGDTAAQGGFVSAGAGDIMMTALTAAALKRQRNIREFRTESIRFDGRCRRREMSVGTAAKTRLPNIRKGPTAAPGAARWLAMTIMARPEAYYAPSLPLRRQGNNAAGKSAAERRSRCGRGGIGRGLGSGAITLR